MDRLATPISRTKAPTLPVNLRRWACRSILVITLHDNSVAATRTGGRRWCGGFPAVSQFLLFQNMHRRPCGSRIARHRQHRCETHQLAQSVHKGSVEVFQAHADARLSAGRYEKYISPTHSVKAAVCALGRNFRACAFIGARLWAEPSLKKVLSSRSRRP